MLYRWSQTIEGKSDLRRIWHSEAWGEDFSIEELEICYKTLPRDSATMIKEAETGASDESVFLSMLLDEVRTFIYDAFYSEEAKRQVPRPESMAEIVLGVKEKNEKAREQERLDKLARAKQHEKDRIERNRKRRLLENKVD